MHGLHKKEKTIRSLPQLTNHATAITRSADNITRKRTRFYKRYFKRHRRQIIRYSLLVANVLVLGAVVFLVLRHPTNSQAISHSVGAFSQDSNTGNPLDTLSSADIAAEVSIVSQLPEAPSVINHADSVNGDLSNAAINDSQVIAKPQIVSAAVKTRADIKTYVVVAGDNLGTLANKFGVTSESIKWSNALDSNTLTPGLKLYIPPINGIVVTVKAGDTPDSLATKYHADKNAVITFNDAELGGFRPGEVILIPNGTIISAVYVPTVPIFSAGFNGYDFGWCTWYVANRRAELGRPVPSNLGDARTWYIVAQREGLATGLTPAQGAVAVNQYGDHVSVVEVVNPDGSFWVSEMNSHGQRSITDSTPWGGWNVRDYKLYTSVGSLKFIY